MLTLPRLLFVATFVWGMMQFFRGRKEGRFMFSNSSSNEHQMESQPLGHNATATGGEKIVASPQQQPVQTQNPGLYQPPVAGAYPPQGQYDQSQYPPGQYPQAGYQPPVSPSPVSAHHYQSPYPQAQELHGQQQHGQYAPQQSYPSQQYGYHQQTTSPHSNELEGQVHQQYEMPSPPTASPPPQQYQQ